MSSDLKIGVLLNFFFGFLFFFSFLRSTLDEITKRYVKNYGFFFWKEEGKKEEKTQFIWKKKDLKKKKARTGFEPAIFGFRQSRVGIPAHTRPTPYHLATEPQRKWVGGIRIIESNNHNALCTSMFITAQQHYYSSTWKYWTYSFIVHLWN